MWRLFLLFHFLFYLQFASAQRFQIGMTVSGNITFPHKATSNYSTTNFSAVPKFANGFELPVDFHLNKVWSFRSGFNFCIKQSALSFNNIDFPDLIYKGYFRRNSRINAFQLPLILVYHYPGTKKKGFSAFLGVLFSKHYLVAVGTKSNFSLQAIGNDLIKYEFSTTANFGSYTTPEIYFGVSHRIFHKTEHIVRHEFKLSFEYAVNESIEQNLEVRFNSPIQNSLFDARISPRLSSFKLSYTFYPLWWAFGKNKNNPF